MSDWSSMREWIQKKLGKRNKTDFIVMLLIGALILIVAIPTEGGGRKEKSVTPQQETEPAGAVQEETYRTQLEDQLKKLLEKVAGVGKCEVMLTLEDDGQICLDKDVSVGGDKREEETVVFRQGDGETPYVIRQKRPQVAGVVVVAEGGGNATVATDISNSVMSLFQLEPHKITVVKMSVQEE